jgi:hypothetical protein
MLSWFSKSRSSKALEPVLSGTGVAVATRAVTSSHLSLVSVTATETDLVSQRVGDYQYVPTIGGLIDQLWVR